MDKVINPIIEVIRHYSKGRYYFENKLRRSEFSADIFDKYLFKNLIYEETDIVEESGVDHSTTSYNYTTADGVHIGIVKNTTVKNFDGSYTVRVEYDNEIFEENVLPSGLHEDSFIISDTNKEKIFLLYTHFMNDIYFYDYNKNILVKKNFKTGSEKIFNFADPCGNFITLKPHFGASSISLPLYHAIKYLSNDTFDLNINHGNSLMLFNYRIDTYAQLNTETKYIGDIKTITVSLNDKERFNYIFNANNNELLNIVPPPGCRLNILRKD